jgi:hypothetical protein
MDMKLVIAKIYNQNCAFFFKYGDENENSSICDSQITTKQCQDLSDNIFNINSETLQMWAGFGESDDYKLDISTAIDGTEIDKGSSFEGKEVVLYAPICDDCACWQDKLNCIFSDCCNNNTTYFEWLDNCHRWNKVEIKFNGTTAIQDKDDTGCGYLNFNLREVKNKYIEKSDVYTEKPTIVYKIEDRKICDECSTECYTVPIWNDNTKTRYCINSNKDKILFTALDETPFFTLIWNNNSYTIPIDLKKEEVAEIENGILYRNGEFFMNLKDLGVAVNGSTTSNGLDCIAIQTIGIAGLIGIIKWKDIERCKDVIWGL